MNVQRWMLALAGLLLTTTLYAADPIRVLIVDGQNNHAWKETTPVLKSILENTNRFKVTVATSPASKQDMSNFRPKFSDFDVVVSNYNGDEWSKETKADFVKFITEGGGLVVVHAADNSFPNWPEWNLMIGLGGWGGRNEKSGPYLRLREDKWVEDNSKGGGGGHGPQHAFVVDVRNADHPITKGLPAKWMHASDELYDKLRGPAKNVTVLASAFADKKNGGTGEHEPSLMVINYEKGRIFHTTQGHSVGAMKCAAFQFTLARGTEWAATGKVTFDKIPDDFPGTDKPSIRK